MGLCVSRTLEEPEEFEEFGEEEDEEEEGGEGCSLQMVSEVSSARVSSSGSRSSRNSTNSLFKALSFDSSRSSAEVGDMGRLGALLCKRRPYVGNPDILSTHLTNILTSILRKSPQDTKSPVDISFASYLSAPFVRSQDFELRRMEDDRLDAIAKSYAESAAKAAARDTFLFLEKNDSLRSFRTASGKFPDDLQALRGYTLDSCVPEEDEITLEEEGEEEEETDVVAVKKSSEDADPGTVDLFKPGMPYQKGELAAQYSEQKSLFESCFPARSGRWASVVNAAKQSACLATRPLQIPAQSLKRQGQVDVQLEGKKNLEGSSSSLGLERGVPATIKAQHDERLVSSPILGCVTGCCSSRETRISSPDAGGGAPDIVEVRTGTSVSNPIFGTKICNDSSRINLELKREASEISEAQKGESSGPHSEIIGVKLQDPDSKLGQNLCCTEGADLSPGRTSRDYSRNVGAIHSQSKEDMKYEGCLPCPMSCLRTRLQAGKERSIPFCNNVCRGNLTQHQPQLEKPDPHPDSFFSFPSSPPSKPFEEVGSGHVIEQMKSTKLMQETLTCRESTVVEEFQGVGFEGLRCQEESPHRKDGFRSPFRASPSTKERAPYPSFNTKLKLVERARNAATPKKTVVSESLASTEETSPCTPGAGHNGDDDSSCESLDIAQGIRIMGFTVLNAELLPSGTTPASASESSTLRNLIHGGKAVQKASTRAKSPNNAPKKAVNNTPQKSISPTIKPYRSISISRSIDVETKTR